MTIRMEGGGGDGGGGDFGGGGPIGSSSSGFGCLYLIVVLVVLIAIFICFSLSESVGLTCAVIGLVVITVGFWVAAFFRRRINDWWDDRFGG